MYLESDKSTESKLQKFSVFMISAGIAESCALLFYYPFDLIKTRMQGSHEKYGYISMLDAFKKIYSGPYSSQEVKYMGLSQTGSGFMKKPITVLSRYYKGMQFHWLAIILVVAIEFGFYEIIYETISDLTKGKYIFTHCLDNYFILQKLRKVWQFGAQ